VIKAPKVNSKPYLFCWISVQLYYHTLPFSFLITWYRSDIWKRYFRSSTSTMIQSL